MEEYKTCSKCGQRKALLEFYKSSKNKSGYESRCKACAYESVLLARSKNPENYRQKQNQWRAANRSHVNKQAREYYWQNPDAKRSIAKKWARANKEKIAAKNASYRLKNRDYLIELLREWRKANPEKPMYYNNLRRTRMQNNGIYLVTAKDLFRLLSRPCFYCGNQAEHVDHVVPIARGGTHSIGNLLPACRTCNQSKGSKFITEWRKPR